MASRFQFRANPVSTPDREATDRNERRFRASVEEAFTEFAREIENLRRQLVEASTARWAEVSYNDITLTDAWQDLVIDTISHNNLKGLGVYRIDVGMLADGSNANSEVQVRALVDGVVEGTSSVIVIGNRVDQKLDFRLFIAERKPISAFDIEVRGLNTDIRAVNAQFTRIGYEETL